MSEQSGSATIRALAATLAPTLGWDKSVEVITATARRLGIPDGTLGAEERKTILEDLALERGIVGVTARYALSRSGISRADMHALGGPPSSQHPTQAPPSSGAGGASPDSSAAARLATTVGVHEVIASISVVLGQDKGEPAVLGAIKRLGLPRERLDREQTTQLLDDLSRQEGHVGATTRFVRARIMAKFGG